MSTKAELLSVYRTTSGRAAPDDYTVAQLRSEIKRMRNVIAMVVRHVMDDMSMRELQSDPVPKIQERLKEYDLSPPRRMIGELAVSHYRNRKKPKKVGRRTSTEEVAASTRKKRVRFHECTSKSDCPASKPVCRNKVCVIERQYEKKR